MPCHSRRGPPWCFSLSSGSASYGRVSGALHGVFNRVDLPACLPACRRRRRRWRIVIVITQWYSEKETRANRATKQRTSLSLCYRLDLITADRVHAREPAGPSRALQKTRAPVTPRRVVVRRRWRRQRRRRLRCTRHSSCHLPSLQLYTALGESRVLSRTRAFPLAAAPTDPVARVSSSRHPPAIISGKIYRLAFPAPLFDPLCPLLASPPLPSRADPGRAEHDRVTLTEAGRYRVGRSVFARNRERLIAFARARERERGKYSKVFIIASSRK